MYVAMDKAKRQPVTQCFKSSRNVCVDITGTSLISIQDARQNIRMTLRSTVCQIPQRRIQLLFRVLIFVDCAVLYIVAFSS